MLRGVAGNRRRSEEDVVLGNVTRRIVTTSYAPTIRLHFNTGTVPCVCVSTRALQAAGSQKRVFRRDARTNNDDGHRLARGVFKSIGSARARVFIIRRFFWSSPHGAHRRSREHNEFDARPAACVRRRTHSYRYRSCTYTIQPRRRASSTEHCAPGQNIKQKKNRALFVSLTER